MNSNLPYSLVQNPSISFANSPANQQTHQQPLQHFPQQQPQSLHSFHLRNDRPMYSSTIQTMTSPVQHQSVRMLGGLQKMGRVVVEETDSGSLEIKENFIQNVQKQGKPLTFRNDRNARNKMAASSIFPPKTHQNLGNTPWEPTGKFDNNGLVRLQGQMTNKRTYESQEQPNAQGVEERRKRQILTFRKDVEFLNKKIQHTFAQVLNGKKEGEERAYFQLPTRKTQPNTQQPHLNTPSSYSTQNTIQSNRNSIPQLFEPNTQPALKQATFNHPNIPQSYIPDQSKESPPPAELQGLFKKKNAYINNSLSKQPHSQLAKVLTIRQNPTSSPNANFRLIQGPQQSPKPLQAKAPRKLTKSDFAIGRKMGKGQFGQVMMVIHKATGFLCGMKVMSKKQIRQQKYVNQIARQLSIQFYLQHRFIAPLYGYFEDQDNLYLLVEFCTDGQLLQKLRKSHRLQEPQTSNIIRQVCQGLDYIHRQQIIHRDIKPQNILFQFGTVKISDFGWAVHAGNSLRKTVSGTPLYYSPELVMQTEYDEKIDVWSVGLMAYECLLGRIPFKIYSQFDLNRIVSDEVSFPDYVDLTEQAKQFMLGALHKKGEERSDIREMLRHPFISRHRVKSGEDRCLQQMRKLLNG